MYEIDCTVNWCNNYTVPVIQTSPKNEWSKNKGGGGRASQAPPLNPPLQQQVYSVLPFLYNNMVLPTEIQIINR